jgi:class 3 adenylate cyclase
MEPSRERFEQYLKERGTQLGRAIHDVWDSRDAAAWAKDPYFFIRLGELADSLGQSMFAHDVLGEGVRCFPNHVRLAQLFSLLLIKCGFLLTARDLLSRLMKQGHFDEETLGMLGRVHKEMWLIEGGGARDHPHLVQAREFYTGAFKRSAGAWSGINAASLSLIMGERATAQRLAREVIRICAEAWKDPAGRDYWTVAALGEAFLVLGQQDKAEKYYRLARRRGGRSFSSMASTRRQLRLLARYTPVDPAVMDTMRIPPVVAFSGHMIDGPGQMPARFPPGAVPAVKKQIAAVLEKLDVRIGYASAACGGDILFHECLQERRGESNVVLPFDRKEFFETSVKPGGVEWTRRAEQVLRRSARVEQATRGGHDGEDVLFTYANDLVLGKAILRSRFLETEPLLLAVWDGYWNDRAGGTADVVRAWSETGFPVILIDPGTAAVTEHAGWRDSERSGGRAPRTGTGRPSAGGRTRRRKGARSAGSRETMAILFADMVGYSRLKDEQIPRYAQGFLRTLANAVTRTGHRPEYKNTWGDALCLVFSDPLAAARCAIAMRDAVRHTDWGKRGLPPDLKMRIGLHAGPVHRVREPLVDRDNFFGFHMNQAARIDPITQPGNVYASEAFASLLLADRRSTLDCRYVGVVVLPKKFGSYPIYHIKEETEVG